MRISNSIFADKRIVVIWKECDKVVNISLSGSLFDAPVRDNFGATIANVVLGRNVEQIRLLRDDRDMLSQPCNVRVLKAVSIDADEASYSCCSNAATVDLPLPDDHPLCEAVRLVYFRSSSPTPPMTISATPRYEG
ncbi:hypothetical protein FRB91_001608 [Serendipita sp. 411]|nr:hypothetical protein FRC15_005265 [Serendipita sp. 397]KAG8828313.1 hypothetical protein FRC19_008430 [Serendipita sp. 401]KAG8839512.1 hypothetical protein FRC18_010290 [Serendipita sp. 400]KAG8845620.1 hypothetical protein FRB91_001608 [Serendipita sp. 411]KAG8867477.1 hypothetical protein FRC20_005631 [Serendipita sp. 405]KAG9054904.1 hypothetical protein FS842_003797 [Serendipita sp. 407]